MTFLRKVFGQGSAAAKGAKEKSDCEGGGPLPILCTNAEASASLAGAEDHSAPLRVPDTETLPQSGAGAIPFAAPVDAVPPPIRVHYRFEDFVMGRTLGTGSFGRVSLALHQPSQQYFAIKKLRKSVVVRLKQVEHTNNERYILANINHPFIVHMVCTFQDQKHLFIVLEYVSGGEFFTMLRKFVTLPPFVAQFYAAEVILALEYLHSRNIVYRDLKPENILIAQNGHIYLTDFGFAKVVPEMTWTLCGTPDYLAPEIVKSQGYSRAVDWFALGVLIYEMLIGMPPFYSDSQMKVYENIVNQPPTFPAGFDPLARHLIERLLEKNPSNRLGVLAGGAGDIKRHPWFRDVKWDLLLQRRIMPPFRPIVAHPGDTSNFDTYPDEEPDLDPHAPLPSEDLFPGF